MSGFHDVTGERLHRAAKGEAEFELIGSLLLNGDGIDDVAAMVRPEYFASERLRDIYSVLLRLRRDDRPTTAEAVAAELGCGEGIVDALHNSMELLPHGLHAEHFARRVKAGWQRRSFGYLMNDTQAELARPDRSPDDVLNHHVRHVEQLLDDEAGDDDGHISDHLLTMRTESVERFTTGLADLDTLLDGGFGAGQLVCIGARPSVGKTAFCSGVALSAARAGVPVLLLSLEMTGQEMTGRCSRQAGVRTHDDTDELNALAGLPLYIREAAGWTIDRIEAEARRYSRRHGVKAVFVDYLSLVWARDARLPRYEQVADISRSLKLLALRTGLAVVAAQQLSREIEKRQNRKPMMSDFRESGSIEQDSDVLIGLDRPVRPDEGDRTQSQLFLM
ncbi:MAG: AAA family ATPase, partial [Planctomycetota bacterium]|nr:AAA family ATPase [Planctomycetota bacterium]